MNAPVKILGADGRPMRRADSSGDFSPSWQTPYAAGDVRSQELGDFFPTLGSADRDYNIDRNLIIARTRDLIRNSGWASSALTRHLDNAIGTGLRLSPKPAFAALRLDRAWAVEFAAAVEAGWRSFAEDPDFYIDATREDNFNGLLRIAYRQRIADGASFALPLWIANKPGNRYATTIQMVDPDRLSNPNRLMDSEFLRGGVEIDQYGAPVAYNITKAHPGDYYTSSGKNFQWERVEAEIGIWTGEKTITRKGVIHAFEKQRAAQSRGLSVFLPVIERLKMVDRYDRYELQGAVINAVLAAYIESPLDHEHLMEALETDHLSKYQSGRSTFHETKNVKFNGARIPTLYPGEKINMLSSTRPNVVFPEFERACLRNIAAGVGLSYEQMTQDWTQTNYSSARAAFMEVYKTLSAHKQDFAVKFADQIYILWMQEAFYRGDLPLPRNAPDFEENKAAYAKCKWIGQGRGYIDPQKEAAAANMRINGGTSTLEDECAEQGKDWREVLHQRAAEVEEMKKLGLALPDWASENPQLVALEQSKEQETRKSDA